MKMNKYFVLVFIALIAFACKDDEINYDPTPEIGIISIAPVIATEFQDDIIIRISYLDGDGDLGENDPNATNLFVIDNRINLTQAYRLPELAPSGSSIAIQGELDVIIPGTGITNGSIQQSATFTLYVIDRAGNESNHVTSEIITIKKP